MDAIDSYPVRPLSLGMTLIDRRLGCGLLIALLLPMSVQPSLGAARGGALQSGAALRILDPRGQATSTTQAMLHVLGRTAPDSAVTVGGQAAQVFPTGVFVRDNVPLQMGENRIVVVATARDGQKAEQVLLVKREAPAPPPLAPAERRLEIDKESIEPSQDVILSRGDVLDIAYRGTPGQKAEYSLGAGGWQPMAEAVDSGSNNLSGLYRATLVATADADAAGSGLRFRLSSQAGASNGFKITGESVVEVAGRAKVGFWGGGKLRLVRVVEDGAGLSFGVHEVRLGGPYLAELPEGTLLRVTGMRGGNYHVQLSPDMDGWISRRAVEWAPEGTPLPHLSFTDLSAYGTDAEDRVGIPYQAPVPFAVTPGWSAAGRAAIHVDFYGAHNAATWISHRPTATEIREVSVEQVGADHLRVGIELKGKQIWGYKCDVTNRALVVTVRRPPKFTPPPASPLTGLLIALEPGHGGSNSGARGISGSQEKDINRQAVEELALQLEAAGAKTIVVRKGDEAISLDARVHRATAANADLLISVHANSAGHTRGYLSVSGTSTYYKWSFSRDLAEAIHARLLEITHLGDFGNVGNFNYYPIRVGTWMPSMLVEQAFMSNPEDEAKMLDPKFRSEMMRAVVLGTQDWLAAARLHVGR